MENRGYILLARKLLHSEIWLKPPEYLKIWIYILMKANYEDTLFPRGTNFFRWEDDKTLLPHITKAQFHKCVKFLKSTTQITTRKTTRGNIITVVNYGKYQSMKNYGATQITTRTTTERRQRGDTINKELKEIKERAEVKTSPEVNSLMGVFKKLVNPNLNFANKTERKACENLLKDHSLKAITENLELIAEHQQKGTPYMPVVTTPYELYNKWAKLVIFFNKQNDT